MKIKGDLTTLKNAFNLVDNHAWEGYIRPHKLGLVMDQMDPANVSKLKVLIKKDGLLEYEPGDMDKEYGVRYEHIMKALNVFNDDAVNIDFDYENKVRFWTDSKEFTTNKLELKERNAKLKEISPHFSATAEVDTLYDFTNDVDNDGQINIEITEDGMELYVDGDMMSYSHNVSGISSDKKIEVIYPTEQLYDFTKALRKEFDEMEIATQSEYPIRIRSENENMKVEYVLAPRVNNS